jgi:mono/diheme cytochrome c family protein
MRALLLLSIVASCQRPEAPVTDAGRPTPAPVALPPVVVAALDLTSEATAARLAKLPPAAATVPADPFYGAGPRRFVGVSWEAALDMLPALSELPAEGHQLRFVCSDGYRTTFPLAASRGPGAVLARSLATDSGEAPFAPELRGRAYQTPAPWYLVWDGLAPDHERPWPYQLVRVEVVSEEALAARWRPPEGAGVERGHALFVSRCTACHSLNLEGGTLGPELNVPRNVLSYRSRSTLADFIRNPASFRAGTVMPPHPLPEADLGALLDYLEAMGRRQVCRTAASCQAALRGLPLDADESGKAP